MRLFLAMVLSEEAEEEVRRVQGIVARQMKFSDVTWSDTSPAHITLQFFEDVRRDALDEFCSRLRDSVFPPPFHLSLEAVSAFPNPKEPKVIFVGIHRSTDAELLHRRTTDAAVEAGLLVMDRLWHPHVTLGRVHVRSEVLVPHKIAVKPIRFQITECVLFESVPSGDHHEHRVIERFSL